MATNANGNVVWKENYRAYGERRLGQPGSEGQRQWFHGKEADAGTGLQYFGARYYDPAVGRFMGVDPVTFQEDNLHSFNRYAYGNNNPVAYLDPDGMQGTRIFDPNRYFEIPLDGGAGGGPSLNDALGVNGIAPLSDAALAAGIASGSGAKSLFPTLRGGAAQGGKPDFIVSRDGAVVHASPEKVRASLQGAGFQGKPVQNSAGTETGTIHNIPGMKMDVRIMDGGPSHPARVVTSRQGTPQPVNPANGSNFGNVPKAGQRERSHIVFP